MKLIFFVDRLTPGGITQFLKFLSEALKRKGHEVIFFGNNSKQIGLGTKFYDVNNLDIPYGFKNSGLIKKIIKYERPDLAVINNVKNVFILNKISKIIPTINYFHDGSIACYGGVRFLIKSYNLCTKRPNIFCFYYSFKERCSFRNPMKFILTYIFKFFEIKYYKKCKKLIVNSNYTKKLIEQLGISNNSQILFPCTKSTVGFDKKILNRDKIILFIGRISAEKGIYELIEIYSLLNDKSHKLFIYGEGPEKQKLNNLIRNKKLDDKIKIKGYIKKGKDLILSKARVLLMPSLCPEAFGIVGIEAMSNRLPIVAYDVGGIRDWLFDGENGFLIPYKDKIQMAKKIDMLISDTRLVEKMGDRGYEIFKEKFSGEKTVLDFINMCQDMIKV